MKNLLLIGIVLGFCFTEVNAQHFVKSIISNLSGGLKSEINASSFILSNITGTKSKMNIGGIFGGFVKLNMADHFAIQEDVLVNYKTSTLEQGGIKNDYQYWGIEVPIYAMGQWKMSNGHKFYLGICPCTEYGLSAKFKTEGKEMDLYEKNAATGKAPMTKLIMGAGAIAGYELGSGIQVNFSYKIGITNTLHTNKDNASMHPSTISLGIGYHF